MKEKIDYLQEFCNKNKLVLSEKGECGFGRACVGILHGDNYLDYNPSNSVDYMTIPLYYSEKHFDITPPDAYHKHNCFAVLANDGDYETAIGQLYDWIKQVEEIGYSVETYETGATGLQALVSGVTGKCIKLAA